MLGKILLVLFLLLAVFVVVVAMQPGEYSVTRSAVIPAPPATTYALVNDFHNWDKWSPWAKLDPNMKVTYSGPESGTGAVYEWTGNDDVGQGKMTITESHPHEHVGIRLEFIAPFESVNQTDFRFQPAGEGTEVTWTMSGENNFVAKAITMFMDMEAMIGQDFEKGLSQLQTAAKEAPAPVAEAEAPPAVTH